MYLTPYVNSADDTNENLCVDLLMHGKGSCYHHAAMLWYLYNRCGWETVRVAGFDVTKSESDHSWCMTKTEEGWRHVDAQFFTDREGVDQFFIKDYSQYFNWYREAVPSTE